jgi:membrane protein required for colicin V production
MTAFDFVVMLVLLLSMLMGWWRGLVYEAITLLSWIVGYIAASRFSGEVMRYLPEALGNTAVRSAVAFALIFALVLILGSVLAWMLSRAVSVLGLGLLDGALGSLFGIVRGMAVCVILVLLAGMTDLPQTEVWKKAMASRELVQVAKQVQVMLPRELAEKIHL